MASLGTAAMMIVHELNNLLTPMVGYAQAALASEDSIFMRKALSITVKNVRSVVALSDRVLSMGAAKKAELQPVSVREAVDQALKSLCRDLSRDGIRFVCDVPENLRVRFDPVILPQVFFNLFLNAREAMSGLHSGCLQVVAGREVESAVIEVSDTGRGIPADILPTIFDPLRSTKPTQRNGNFRCGGLGLALCRDLIQDVGGTIDVSSTPGQGTTFRIRLPLSREVIPAGTAPLTSTEHIDEGDTSQLLGQE